MNVLPDVKIENYLDVGCSEGKITLAVAKRLGLTKNNTFACDIIVPDYISKGGEQDNVIFKLGKSSKIPFETNSMDLVTTFMSFHHFTNPVMMVNEIKRVLKDGGIFIMREHNAETIDDITFFDFVDVIPYYG